MPHPAAQSIPATPAVAIVPAWAPVALTACRRAACRLSEFQDAWAELSQEDRAWFAEDLRELLIDAVLGETA